MTFRRISIFVALAALACYAISLRATLIYDDRRLIEFDPRIAHFDQWHRYFTQTYNDGVDNLYRPLTSFSFAFQHAMHGTEPLPYHVVNWLLHALVSVQVGLLTWTWFESNSMRGRIALISGLLFALHPVHVEAVVGVVGRAELLCAAFFLGALQLISRPLTSARSFAAILCLVGAIASKEQGIVLIPVALIVRYFIGCKSMDDSERKRLHVTFACASVFLALYVIWREDVIGLKFIWETAFLDTRIQPLATITDQATRLVAPLPIVGRALAQLFFPLNLTIDYAGSINARADFNSIWPWLGIIAITLWIALFVRAAWTGDRTMKACLLAFVITYGLVSNIVMTIGTAFGERLLYLPSVFFVMIIASWLVRLPRRVTAIVVCAICVGFSLRCITYTSLWSDRLTLYKSQSELWPQNPRLHLLYGLELFERGEKERGLSQSLQAVEVDRDYDRALLQSARLLVSLGRLEEAEALLDRLDKFRPGASQAIRIDIARRRLELPTTHPSPPPLNEKPAGE